LEGSFIHSHRIKCHHVCNSTGNFEELHLVLLSNLSFWVAELFNSKPEASGQIVSPLDRNESHMFEPVILNTEETRKTITVIHPPHKSHQM
jgi:hypothetical protein